MIKRSLVALAAVFLPVQVHAACTLAITANNVSFEWNPDFTVLGVEFTVVKSSQPECTYGIAFTAGGSGDYTTRRVMAAGGLRYQLYKDPGMSMILKDRPSLTGNNDVIKDYFPAGEGLQHTLIYYIDIPYSLATSPLASVGEYSDTFSLVAYEGDNPAAYAPPEITSDSVLLTVTVPEILGLSITNRGSSYNPGKFSQDVPFGLITTGMSREFDVVVKANVPYSLSFTSANGKKMKLGNSQVPYRFYANGAPLNLNGDGLSSAGGTGVSGQSHPIKIAVDPVAPMSAVAGEHSDTITVTVSPN